ncbi:addiction module protein [Dehalococcoidia bacterium]|nr:addiction module protein [Dehalococcoidia bacterium]
MVEDIWDSIAEMPEAVELPAWHKQELEKRLEAYHANPNEETPVAARSTRVPLISRPLGAECQYSWS